LFSSKLLVQAITPDLSYIVNYNTIPDVKFFLLFEVSASERCLFRFLTARQARSHVRSNFGRLWAVVEATISHRIAGHSPLDLTGNRTGLPPGSNTTQSLIYG